MHTVYLALNLLNGKRYVGVTGAGILVRKGRHIRLAKTGRTQCPRLYDAIRKYGDEAFNWVALAHFESKDSAYRHERVMVSYLQPEYNVAPGGISGPAKGRGHKPVICLDSGLVFPSTAAAARANGVRQSNISGACRGLATTVKGKFFQFYLGPMTAEDRKTAIGTIVQRGVEKRSRVTSVASFHYRPLQDGINIDGVRWNGPAGLSIEVVCLTDGRSFHSTTAAAEFYGTDPGSISRACRGARGIKMVKGHRFAYARDADREAA
jgi:hypothetical protein